MATFNDFVGNMFFVLCSNDRVLGVGYVIIRSLEFSRWHKVLGVQNCIQQ